VSTRAPFQRHYDDLNPGAGSALSETVFDDAAAASPVPVRDIPATMTGSLSPAPRDEVRAPCSPTAPAAATDPSQ